MEREMRKKVLRLILIVLGYLIALMFLLGGIVYLLVHMWLSGLILIAIAISLFLLTMYYYLGTSVYVIFEDSMYVPRLYRHGDAKKKEIVEFKNVKKVVEIKGILHDGFLLYISSKGYYFVRRSVFSEIREKLSPNVEIIWVKKS